MAGGVAAYSYAVTEGTLPAGTSSSGLSLAGTLKGVSGWLKFGVFPYSGGIPGTQVSAVATGWT